MRAFTLLELLVSVAIVAVLVGILLVGLAGVRATGPHLACLHTLKDMTVAVRVYADANREALPQDWETLEYAPPRCRADAREDFQFAYFPASYEIHSPEWSPGQPPPQRFAVKDAFGLGGGLIVSDVSEWHPRTHDINDPPRDAWRNGGYLDGHAARMVE